MEHGITLAWEHVIALIIPQFIAIITFLIYIRTELASLKTWKHGFEKRYEADKIEIKEAEKTVSTDIKEMREEVTKTKDMFSNQLYDLNSKVTESATIIKMKFLNDKN